MTVKELIAKLQEFPPEMEVYTNECEATSSHEEISPMETVELVVDIKEKLTYVYVYAGTGEAR